MLHNISRQTWYIISLRENMLTTPPSLAAAKESALSLLRQYNIDQPPISFSNILSGLGLSLVEKEFE